MSQRLPVLPHLDHLKKQAKDVVRVARLRTAGFRLAEAQQAVARGYGFANWKDLKDHVESARHTVQKSGSSEVPRHSVSKGQASIHLSEQAAGVRSFQGTWATPASPADANCREGSPQRITLDFQIGDNELILTQIAADATGEYLAIRMTMVLDGKSHPIPFGADLTLQVVWSDRRTLGTIVRQSGRVVAEGRYSVSSDGRALRVSTPQGELSFERV